MSFSKEQFLSIFQIDKRNKKQNAGYHNYY